MPDRPPRGWWNRTVAGIEASGGAVDPRAVAGAMWGRKSVAEKRRITNEEEGPMTTKKRKKKHGTRRHLKKHASPKKHHHRSRRTKGASHHACPICRASGCAACKYSGLVRA
jgi:hypothetical protein